MDDISLKDALSMFVQGTKDLALSNALNKANEQVQQIKMSGIKDTDQRLALGNLAQSLVGQMGVLGANASMVEQTRLAFQPKQYASIDAAILDASLSGDKGLAEKAIQADAASATSELTKFQAKAKIQQAVQDKSLEAQAARDEKKFEQQKQLLEMKQSYMQKSLSDTEITKLQGLDTIAINVSDLLDQVKKDKSLVGPVAGRVPGREMVDEKFASFKMEAETMFNQYRKEITGAGASIKELDMLRKAQPSVTDRAPIFMAKAKKMLDMGNKIKQRYMQNLENSGRDVSGFAKGAEAAAPTLNLRNFIK